ncbi:hypothetical protein FRB99_008157 [Tulasnella sp. 403]|nr:hypothetical protein FRB99_008157 [Tulasnella sp. 403]
MSPNEPSPRTFTKRRRPSLNIRPRLPPKFLPSPTSEISTLDYKPNAETRSPLSPGSSVVGRVIRNVRKQSTLWSWTSDEGDEDPFEYPNARLVPRFGRRQTTLIAISGVIGTGLFLGSGQAIVDGGPLGVLLGYLAMSSVAYGMVVSSAEMVAVYPYCRGTVGLADRFVDPALGPPIEPSELVPIVPKDPRSNRRSNFPTQVLEPSWSTVRPLPSSRLNFTKPDVQSAPLWPPILIALTSASVFGSKIYGEFESVFAIVKVTAAIMLVILSIVIDTDNAVNKGLSPFRFWKKPFAQYLGIDGSLGRMLGFFAVFIQAAVSFFGSEIPTLIAGEVIDAPNVIVDISRRVWIRVTIIYTVMIFTATTLVSRDILAAHRVDPTNPNSPSDDAPWHSSPFLVALSLAGSRYHWVTNLFIAMFITSALSAASSEVFISSRYLYFLSRAGHAPKLFGKIYPDTDEARAKGAVVPLWGVVVTVGFATLSFMCMRPKSNTMTGVEKVFKWINSMTSVASLQAWIGTLFTYYRFWRGTQHPLNKQKYPKEIARILQVRARGQPFVRSVSLFVGPHTANEGVVTDQNPASGVKYPHDQVLKFFTTYVPLPVLLLLIFWYKLINQTKMKRAHEMDFSGVVWPNEEVVQKRPKGWAGRIWWWLVY